MKTLRHGYLFEIEVREQYPDYDEKPQILRDIEEHGYDAQSDTALLTVLTGKRETANALMHEFGGSLERIATATISELMAIDGIGKARAIELQTAFQLAKRMQRRAEDGRPRLESPGDVAEYMRETFRGREQEEFHVLLLETKHQMLKDVCVTVGLLDRAQVHAREVFRQAIKEACSRVILVHNHPSGDPAPSAQDISCTKNLVAAGNIIGIEVLDHVVIGKKTSDRPRDYLSMREEGLLK